MNLRTTKPTGGSKPTLGIRGVRSQTGEISLEGSAGSNFGPVSVAVEPDGSVDVQIKIPTPAPGLGVIAGAEVNPRTGEIESVTGGITAGGIVDVSVTVEGCEVLMLVEIETPFGVSFGFGQKSTIPGCEESPPPNEPGPGAGYTTPIEIVEEDLEGYQPGASYILHAVQKGGWTGTCDGHWSNRWDFGPYDVSLINPIVWGRADPWFDETTTWYLVSGRLQNSNDSRPRINGYLAEGAGYIVYPQAYQAPFKIRKTTYTKVDFDFYGEVVCDSADNCVKPRKRYAEATEKIEILYRNFRGEWKPIPFGASKTEWLYRGSISEMVGGSDYAILAFNNSRFYYNGGAYWHGYGLCTGEMINFFSVEIEGKKVPDAELKPPPPPPPPPPSLPPLPPYMSCCNQLQQAIYANMRLLREIHESLNPLAIKTFSAPECSEAEAEQSEPITDYPSLLKLLFKRICEGSDGANAEKIEAIYKWTGADRGQMILPDSVITPPPKEGFEGFLEGILDAITPDKTREINSIPEFFAWAIEQISALVGDFGQVIEISEKTQEQTGLPGQMYLPDIATALTQAILLLINLQNDEKIMMNLGTAAIVEGHMARQQATMANFAAEAILKALGGDFQRKPEKLKATFSLPADIQDTGEVDTAKELEEFLKPSEVSVPVVKYTDRRDLKDELKPLLEAATAILAVHTIKFKASSTDEELRTILRNISLRFASGNGAEGSEGEGEGDGEDWNNWTEKVEEGFTQDGTTDPLNPYGRPRDRRPHIRNLSSEPNP